MYLYPDNLKAKARLWLWELRDVAAIAVALLIFSFFKSVYLICPSA